MPAKFTTRIILGLFGFLVFSCQNADQVGMSPPEDTSAAAADQTDSFNPEDTMTQGSLPDTAAHQSAPVIKGTAVVYCAPKMIKDIPTIVNAVVSKEEISVAISHFAYKLQKTNPDVSEEDITRGIRADTLTLYQHMGVKLEFDPEDFKQVAGEDHPVQDFTDKTSLEWEWVLKPLRSTRKSIIKFSFYCVDPYSNQQSYLLEKTISVSVRVDARSFLEKWGDFMLDDPKTTLTAILIPLITFFGGFISGKRKKKAA